MTTIHTEQILIERTQNTARQRLVASRQDIILLKHLLQASLIVEREHPLRQALTTHRQLIYKVAVIAVFLLSVTAGLLAPQIVQALTSF